MVTQNVYIEANAPTVAENAIKNALWSQKPPRETISRHVDHSTKYGVPPEEFQAEIMRHLSIALSGPDGFSRFVRSVLWRTPENRTVKQYIERELESTLTPAQIVQAVNALM